MSAGHNQMVGEVFTRDRGEAENPCRHTDMEPTADAYRHHDVEAQRQRLEGLIEGTG